MDKKLEEVRKKIAELEEVSIIKYFYFKLGDGAWGGRISLEVPYPVSLELCEYKQNFLFAYFPGH